MVVARPSPRQGRIPVRGRWALSPPVAWGGHADDQRGNGREASGVVQRRVNASLEKPMRLPFAIVPRRGVSTLCTVDAGRLVEINPVPVPPLAECAISDTGWIAWTEADGGTVD